MLFSLILANVAACWHSRRAERGNALNLDQASSIQLKRPSPRAASRHRPPNISVAKNLKV